MCRRRRAAMRPGETPSGFPAAFLLVSQKALIVWRAAHSLVIIAPGYQAGRDSRMRFAWPAQIPNAVAGDARHALTHALSDASRGGSRHPTGGSGGTVRRTTGNLCSDTCEGPRARGRRTLAGLVRPEARQPFGGEKAVTAALGRLVAPRRKSCRQPRKPIGAARLNF